MTETTNATERGMDCPAEDDGIVDAEALRFFDAMPQAIALYEALVSRLCAEFGDITIRVQKSQIAFANRHSFAFAWLPVRHVKGRPDVYLVVSLGLDYRVTDPRIEQASEPYPNRWTHHVIVQAESEIDEQLMEWIEQAYLFALNK